MPGMLGKIFPKSIDMIATFNSMYSQGGAIMKTLNRPTASVPPARISLSELTARVRKLWSIPPQLSGDERDEAITTLIEVDVALERLDTRARCHMYTSDDLTEHERCRSAIERLERQWTSAPAPELAVAS